MVAEHTGRRAQAGRPRHRALLVALLVGGLIGGPGAAGPALAGFQEGLKAYEAGDFDAAAKAWQEAAQAGDMAAMRNLAHLYRWGRGVPQDTGAAVEWYQRAALLGFDRAQYNLGAMYEAGEGVNRDQERAVYWYNRAADQGNGAAQMALARLLIEGDGVEPDLDRASVLLRQAIATGHEEARVLLRQADARRAAGGGTTVTVAELPQADAAIQPAPAPKAEPALEVKAEPAPAPKAEPAPEVKAEPAPAVKAEPAPEVKAEPAPAPKAEPAPAPVVVAQQEESRLPPPDAPTPVPVEEPRLISPGAADGTMAHLGIFRSQAEADAAWQALAEKQPGLAETKPYVMPGYVPELGNILRLYAQGDQATLTPLCRRLRTSGQECELHRFFR